MDDTTDATAVAEPTSTETDTTLLSFIDTDADGTLKEGWREHVPEEYRNDKVFDRAVSLKGLFKTVASAERKFGKKQIALPDGNSTESDWEEFHKALGRLDKPENYKFDKDPDIPDELWPEGLTGAMQKAAFESGANEKQLEVFNKIFNEFYKAQITKTQTDKQLAYDEELKGLKEEWSGTYDANIHLGNVALEKGTDGNPELKERIKEKFGPDPDFVRLMRNLGVSYKESSIPDAGEGSSLTVSQVEEQMTELRNSDAYRNKMNPGHKDALKRMTQLYETKAKIR
jgi:hypothetical protein